MDDRTTAFDRRQIARVNYRFDSRRLLLMTRLLLGCLLVGVGISFYDSLDQPTATHVRNFTVQLVFFGSIFVRFAIVEPVFRELTRLREEVETLKLNQRD